MEPTSDVPNLDRVFGAFVAYQQTGAIHAAVELDLFTAVGEGATDAEALAARLGVPARGVRMLADALVAYGFLAKDDGRYAPTATSAAFLDRRSPAFVGDAVRFIASPTIRDAFARTAAAVRRGGTALDDSGGTTAAEHPVWVEFARAMAPAAGFVAALVADAVGVDADADWRVLDVAAGHGKFGIAIAERSSRARIVAQDWPAVLDVAAEFAAAAGLADRWSRLPGDALSVELGGGYDLVLLTNLLHHFDPPTCVALLRRIRASIAPGGRVATVEIATNADRVTPPPTATFALVMLVTTPAGDAYTVDELVAMFREAGFARNELHELPPSSQRLLISSVDS
jgi:2-polyprenyl-3-methyl-5-hydroxy-6-metoxy-1,4-benzoquinol methylase